MHQYMRQPILSAPARKEGSSWPPANFGKGHLPPSFLIGGEMSFYCRLTADSFLGMARLWSVAYNFPLHSSHALNSGRMVTWEKRPSCLLLIQ